MMVKNTVVGIKTVTENKKKEKQAHCVTDVQEEIITINPDQIQPLKSTLPLFRKENI